MEDKITQKEKNKKLRLFLVTQIEELKSKINQSNPGIVDEKMIQYLDCLKNVAKLQAETLRLAEVCCFCGHEKDKDSYFKKILYDSIKNLRFYIENLSF